MHYLVHSLGHNATPINSLKSNRSSSKNLKKPQTNKQSIKRGCFIHKNQWMNFVKLEKSCERERERESLYDMQKYTKDEIKVWERPDEVEEYIYVSRRRMMGDNMQSLSFVHPLLGVRAKQYYLLIWWYLSTTPASLIKIFV